MKSLCAAILCLLLAGCTTRETKNYITNNTGPGDWQPPVVSWLSPLDAEVRGTVGLDVTAVDSSAIVRVSLYLDGRERQTLTAPPFRFEVVTDSLLDGIHWCEARAVDEFGNLGLSPTLRVNVMNSMAEGPRLIWVPDSFATIQAAINAATDFDTIRVRDGVYYETLNLFGKGIWLESEHGPLHCHIDNAGAYNDFFISNSHDRAMIRGFFLSGHGELIGLGDGALVDIVNCIAVGDSTEGLLITGNVGSRIHNNLFSGSQYPIQISYCWGSFYNNIVQNSLGIALWNAALSRNPLEYGYDLLWNNFQNYGERFQPGVGDVYEDPRMDLENGLLLSDSPAIDSGNPNILDTDGSRSDIGPFGGPYAY